ncbi:MAG: ABC transporter permease [Planctomycetes bacterium]|nr:ABC transporter permease [Planctomycetota bacterium]
MNRLFPKLVLRSLTRRPMRFAVASLALALGTSMVALALNLSFGIRGNLQRAAAEFGANAYLVPRAEGTEVGAGGLSFGTAGGARGIPAASLAHALAALGEGVQARVVALVRASVGSEEVLLAGTDPARVAAFRPWWTLQGPGFGAEPAGGSGLQVAASPRLAARLAWRLGERRKFSAAGGEREAVLVALIDGMGEEEGLAIAPLEAVRALAADAGLSNYVEVRASSAAEIPSLRARLEREAPETLLRGLDQVNAAEEAVLARIEWLLALISCVVLTTAGIAVTGALTLSVMERRPEIGLMKVLGAGGRQVLALFLTEGALVGVAGGLPGGLLGLALSDLVARQVFGTAPGVDLRVPFVALGTGVAVALVSSIVPVRRALAVDPAVTLRGE